jgi:hypothetical protein
MQNQSSGLLSAAHSLEAVDMDSDAKSTGPSEAQKRSWSGFDKASDYFTSLKATPRLFSRRALYVRHPEEQLADKAAAEGQLKQVLNWFHVMALGTGNCIV